jgi:ATP-dependent helicase/nuclease subunit A
VEFTLNQKKAHDLERHVSVTAGAGSGKTAALVSRYLKILVEKNVRVNQVVAITFTEKAAAELKQRIVREIDVRIASGDAAAPRLEETRAGMAGAQISTIHSFCARILREYPVEAGVDAGFSVLQGVEQRLLLREMINDTLRHIAGLPEGTPTREELAYLLRIFGGTRLASILYQLCSRRDAVARLLADIYSLTDAEVQKRWRDFVQTQLSQSLINQFPIERWMECLNAVLKVAKGKNALRIQELIQQLQPENAIATLTQIVPLIVTQEGTIRKNDFLGRSVKADAIESEIDFLVQAAEHFSAFPDLTDDDALLIHITRPLLDLYTQIQQVYERHKLQQGQLDFEDLQIKVRDLLRQDAIRERLARRYAYIMVDEYQDTNRLQYEILKPLISNFASGNLFIVGDPKQSIYGFRNADVRVFRQTQREIVAYQSEFRADFVWENESLPADELERRGNLHLPENFRLLRNLVGAINLIFESIMGAASLNEFEVGYEPLIKGRANDDPGDVELILATKEKDTELIPVSENELIVARIRHLIGTQATASPNETPRSIRYGDIAILIRSRTRLPEIESALLKADIPYNITGGVGFYQRQEIYDICNYLQFLAHPDDNIALVGILRAPFFGVSDVELYEIAIRPGAQSFWSKVQAYADEQENQQTYAPMLGGLSSRTPIQFAVERLRHHLEVCHRLLLSMLIRKIVNDTGMVGVLPVGQQGEQRWVNYEKLLDIAREFDRAGFIGLPDFVERLKLLIEEEERESQATTALTDNAVQVMTVHAAKGLEFPVVILPLLERKFQYDSEPFIDDSLGLGFSPPHPERGYENSDPAVTRIMRNRAKNRIDAEEKRLFYVAATRARDRLIFSGTLDHQGKAAGWLGWMLDALGITGMPQTDWIERPVTIQALSPEGSPPYKGGARGGDFPPSGSQGATPISFNLPIRIIKSLDALDFEAELVPPSPRVSEFPEFHIDALTTNVAGEMFSVTELTTYAHCPMKFYLRHRLHIPESLNEQRDHSPYLDDDGTEIGRAVHAVLAKLRTREDCERRLEKALNNAASETVSVEKIRKHVQCFLSSEIGQLALRAAESACEKRIDALFESHQVAGAVDRMFKDAAGLWWIVDYKTDEIDKSLLANRIRRYQPQIELYALLVHRLYPEQPVIPATVYFTHLAEAYSMRMTQEALAAAERTWLERLKRIQAETRSGLAGGIIQKNTEHCPLCPYFVGERCIASH